MAIDKMLITEVFEALGPKRVARGLTAKPDSNWQTCFLATAYGEPGALYDAMLARPALSGCAMAGDVLHCSAAAVLETICAFDEVRGDFKANPGSRAELFALAREWLEVRVAQVEREPVSA